MEIRIRVRIEWLVVAFVLMAGCAGIGSNDTPAAEYQGEFVDVDLFLHNLRTSGQAGGWELYRGANVDAWAFSKDENDARKATVPAPEIRAREGDTVRVNFYTSGSVPMAHTLHWHGVHVPWQQDGVPYMTQLPIGPGNAGGNGKFLVTYEFQVDKPGTYWYHCHVDTAHHLDMGMYGPFIVEPKDPKQDPPFDQEATLVLDEWDRSHAHSNEQAISSAISKSGDPRVTANDFYSSIRDYLLMNQVYNDTVARNLKNVPGIRETRDWYPVTYPPYFAEYDTYLINGKAFPDTAPIFVKNGQILRLRLVNAGEEVHALHLHGHHMFVTHKDGYIVPLLKQLRDASGIRTEEEMSFYAQGHDTILIAPGERYDAYVYLTNPGPWHIHDHISLNEQNDYIAPGGMATMICYTDGWENAQEECKKGHELHKAGETVTAGDLLRWRYEDLVAKDPAGAVRGAFDETEGVDGPVGTASPVSTAVPPTSGPAPSTSPGIGIPPVGHTH